MASRYLTRFHRSIAPFVLCLLVVLGASACVPAPSVAEFTDELSAPDARATGINDSFGQTFVARHGGLQGIGVQLESAGGSTSRTINLTLHLRASPFATTDLRTTVLSASEQPGTNWQMFRFLPIADSNGASYYVLIEAQQPAGARLQTRTLTAEAYNDGAFYLEQEAQEAQLVFRLVYDPWSIALDLLQWIGGSILWCTLGVVVFILPGLMVLSPLCISLAERLSLAGGMTICLYAVAALWTHLAGFQMMSQFASVTTGAGLVWIAVKALRADWRRATLGVHWRAFRSSGVVWPVLTFGIVGGLLVFSRLFAIRGLTIPMWGDSYHHTMIAQLISDNNGLFSSWAPYAELQTLTYHFGFHVIVAAWHWISQMPMPLATLWTGQFLNILAVLAVCPLAARLGGGHWTWPAAAIVAGLLSPMPMYYVNWGRYTQLAGQVALPLVVLLTWQALEQPQRDRRFLAITALAWGGLALTHYRVLIMGICFVLAWLVVVGWRQGMRQRIGRLALIAAGGALLFLPWFLSIYGGRMMAGVAQGLSTPPQAASAFVLEYNAIGDLQTYLPIWLWLGMALAIVLAMLRRPVSSLLQAVAWIVILIAANPQWLNLPGQGAVSNFAVFIAAYMPAAAFVGSMLGMASTKLNTAAERRGVSFASGVLAMAFVLVGVWGLLQRSADLRIDSSALAWAPDLRAAAWIRDHTSRDAKFLVNSFFAYGGSVVVGSDGGWWLPLLANRGTTLPPINYANEEGSQPGYAARVNALPALIQQDGATSATVLAQLRAEGITHVYIGQRQGRVNYDGPYVLKATGLINNPAFEPIYHQDRVWVFRIRN